MPLSHCHLTRSSPNPHLRVNVPHQLFIVSCVLQGYSLHLQIDTFLFDSSSNPVGGPSATIATGGVAAPDLLDADSPTGSGKKTRLIHRAFCQVKVFSEKGAERKARSEDRRRNEFLAGPRAFVERFASAITTPSANNAAADTTTTTTTLSTTTGGAAVGSASNRDEDEEEGASSDEAESSKKDAKTASLATALSASGLNSPSTIGLIIELWKLSVVHIPYDIYTYSYSTFTLTSISCTCSQLAAPVPWTARGRPTARPVRCERVLPDGRPEDATAAVPAGAGRATTCSAAGARPVAAHATFPKPGSPSASRADFFCRISHTYCVGQIELYMYSYT